jgi:hypothetical protein
MIQRNDVDVWEENINRGGSQGKTNTGRQSDAKADGKREDIATDGRREVVLNKKT